MVLEHPVWSVQKVVKLWDVGVLLITLDVLTSWWEPSCLTLRSHLSLVSTMSVLVRVDVMDLNMVFLTRAEVVGDHNDIVDSGGWLVLTLIRTIHHLVVLEGVVDISVTSTGTLAAFHLKVVKPITWDPI